MVKNLYMNRFVFQTIRGRLTFWFLLLALVPLLFGILIAYNLQKNTIEREAFNKLTAVRDLKVRELDAWLDERVGDVHIISADYEIRGLGIAFNAKEKSITDIEKMEIATSLLDRYIVAYKNYEEIFLINAETGIIEISTNPQFIGNNKRNNIYFTKPLETEQLFIKDIHYYDHLDKPQMCISIPVFDEDDNTHISAVLVARIDLEKSLYHLLENTTGMGETGETLIVNPDVIALNDLKYTSDAILKIKIEAEPAVNAAAGQTGITKTLDYRGVEVLAAYTYIPSTKWGFISKQDMFELNAPIRALGQNYILLFIISALTILLVVFWLSKRISRPISNMYNVSKKIKDGDYSIKNTITSVDEIGALGSAINEMSDAISSKSKVQNAVSKIARVMIGNNSFEEFTERLLEQLMDITNSQMSIVYSLDRDSQEFVYFSSIGANHELFKPFTKDSAEGEFDTALKKESIVYLNSIPDETNFKYVTSFGHAKAKGIITIPIVINKEVTGIISLASIHVYTAEVYEILETSWSSINIAYSNLLANQKTQDLAQNLSKTNQQLEAQTEELQDQTEELHDQASELQKSALELHEQNVELEVQRKQVESANQLKSEFLSNMSHELRTPLNSIMALSRVLIMQAKDKLDDEENSYLEIVERNGKRLLSLINNILDLSKIESGKLDIAVSSISLKTLLQIIAENIQGLSEEKALSVRLNISDNFPMIETDEARLHQVLLNIVGNAVKFTSEGSIDISVTEKGGRACIAVKDTGVGIAKEMLPRIFEEFKQADGTSSRQFQGTGLGLAIAQKLTHILGGEIKVESVLDKGSVFTICIPFKWDNAISSQLIEINNLPEIEEAYKTILVVDDEPEILNEISDSLKNTGYKVITASSGMEAIRLAKKYQPFAITLDVIMPEMDGWEVLQVLKNDFDTKDIPVIIVSVSNDQDTGFALGAIGYLNKPVIKTALISEIYKSHHRPKTVMIIDDNDFELKQLEKIIEGEGLKAISSSNGKDGLKILESKSPDVIVLDLMMPEMDGFEVLNEIRTKDKTKDIPVIIVSAKDLTSQDRLALSGRVEKLITKSEASQTELLTEINRIINQLESGNISSPINTKKTLLIVEDNLEAIVQVKAVLESENYHVEIAEGGQEALDYLKTNTPDGVILDLMMPKVDGFEVMKSIRTSLRSKSVPIVVLTAKDLKQEDIAVLNEYKIKQVIQKGDINIEGLLVIVKKMIYPESEEDSGSKKLILKNPKSKPHVLIIEDHIDNMITIKAILGDRYQTSEATDGAIGVDKIKTLKPDLVLLDMSLPIKSGEEVLSEIRGDKNTMDIPIVAVTAMAMKGDKARIIAQGCNGYVSKPIDGELLLSEIEKYMKFNN